MTISETLSRILEKLPEGRQREVLSFAEYLAFQQEREVRVQKVIGAREWRPTALAQSEFPWRD